MDFPTRILGTTGLEVTRIGLGLAALGRPGYINLGHASDLEHDYDVRSMELRSHRVLDTAWSAGIRAFDVARSYGRAEQFLGSWLRSRQIAPESVTVSSKWGYAYTANWQVQAAQHEVKELSLARLRQQWTESLELLGDQIDLYQIHSATLESGVFENTAVLKGLAQIKDEGIAVGLSLSGPHQGEALRKALELTLNGVRLFDTVQASWNLLEPSVGPALAEAHDAGMGVIIKEAVANGRLTARNSDPTFAEQRRLLQQQANRFGVTLDALSIAAALAQPWADMVLSGAASGQQLQENLTALKVNWDDQASVALDALAEPAEQYWQERSQMSWN